MGRLICPLFYVHTSPSVHVTEPKLPVGPGSLAACLDIRRGFVEQSKPSPFLLVATTAYLRNGSVALPQIDWGRTGTRPRARQSSPAAQTLLSHLPLSQGRRGYTSFTNCITVLIGAPTWLLTLQASKPSRLLGLPATFLQRLSVKIVG